jgi:hypothetical protein
LYDLFISHVRLADFLLSDALFLTTKVLIQQQRERGIFFDWVHLGTLGTRGGELAAAEHPHVLG